MSDRGEMWVHGNSVVIQYPGGEGLSPFMRGHRMLYAPDPDTPPDPVPWSDLLGVRSSSGATFRGAFGDTGIQGRPSTNRFHFSIPTPAFFPQPGVTHQAITVDKVSVYFSTSSDNVFIMNIAVTGGGTTQGVGGFSGRLSGTHTGLEVGGQNAWMLISPITMGLGRDNSVLVSVDVRFDVNGEITFTAAAIHYRVGA